MVDSISGLALAFFVLGVTGTVWVVAIEVGRRCDQLSQTVDAQCTWRQGGIGYKSVPDGPTQT